MVHGLLPDNPFETIDEDGAGELMWIATAKGRRANPDLRLGICGEHGVSQSPLLYVISWA